MPRSEQQPEPPEQRSPGPEPTPAQPAGEDSKEDGLSQESDEDLEALLEVLAPGYRRHSEQQRAQQRAKDVKIVERLRAQDFKGPNSDMFHLWLRDYSIRVITVLISTGGIFARCAKLGRHVAKPDDYEWMLTRDVCEQLTAACVDKGLEVFHEHALRRGGWRPDGKASLSTYAVNQCVREFPPPFRHWLRRRLLSASFLDAAGVPERAIDHGQPDPADVVANRSEAEWLLAKFPEPERTALRLRAEEGLTQEEAAARVGLTAKALESRIGRARSRLGLTRQPPSRPNPINPVPKADPKESM